MHGKHYFRDNKLECTGNGFHFEGEFFNQHSVDEGVLFGFHRNECFHRDEKLGKLHFHDMEKQATQERIDNYEIEYKNYLKAVFADKESQVLN
jgi:modulator of drug activity B